MFNRGFTLIELLVVIAIIGILASVVLASLNSARDKGSNASAISSLNNARAQAELYFTDNGNSYDGVCSALATADPAGIQTLLDGASGAVTGTASCGDDVESWAAEVPLNAGDGFYCVDYGGNATTSPTTTISPDSTNGDTTFNEC